jgi:hypothetical protein
MTGDSKLAMSPQFSVRAIAPGNDAALVDGSFSRPDRVAVGDRGWLFVSETEPSIGDVVTLDGDAARLDVPNWSMTSHVHEGASSHGWTPSRCRLSSSRRPLHNESDPGVKAFRGRQNMYFRGAVDQ